MLGPFFPNQINAAVRGARWPAIDDPLSRGDLRREFAKGETNATKSDDVS